MLASHYSFAEPTWEGMHGIGFRVAYVPEPSTLALLGIGAIGVLACRWRRWKRPVP